MVFVSSILKQEKQTYGVNVPLFVFHHITGNGYFTIRMLLFVP